MGTPFVWLALCLLPLVWASLETAEYSNAHFSREMYSAVSDGSNNLVCSPLGAQMTLGLIRLGARSRTEQQISRALALENVARDESNAGLRDLTLRILEENALNGTVIRLANRLYASRSLRLLPEFQREAENFFGVKGQQVDFEDPVQASQTINSWVENFTQGKIKDLISPSGLTRATQLVLVNALYFRSLWKSAFDPNDTRNRTFHLTPEERVQIPFMFQEGDFRIGHFRNLDASLLELPYQGDYLSLVILKPNRVTGLPALEQAMRTRDLGELLTQSHVATDIEIFVPRFTMEVGLELNEPLKKMGITDMFGSAADLSRIALRSANDAPLAVSKVAQKTFIEVTEQGTEAAAGTYATSMFLSAASFNQRFDANSPFLFYLVFRPRINAGQRPRTRTVLFSGRFTGRN